VARLSRLGWHVTLLTVFTESVPEPSGFALACQTDKGIPATADYMRLRRAEDEAACRALGAEPVHLANPEAPHRGYESASELFAGVMPGDDAHLTFGASLTALIQSLGPELVFAPQGLGGHVDHLQVVRALDGESRQLQNAGPRLLYYRDTPYALREREAVARVSGLSGALETGVAIRHELEDKLRACAAYETQIEFQFGGVEDMREALERFSFSEGRRLSYGAPVETYLGGPAGVRALGVEVGGVIRVIRT
jgi:LmbE family N-acetylglucosaminyl deacetylase